MSFESLGLSAGLLRALAAQSHIVPTPIQTQAIPVVLAGRDLLARAQTGTGKTAAFALPILQRLASAQARGGRPIRALVLTPTRELAAQVHENTVAYGEHLPLKAAVIFGGVGFVPQVAQLRRGVDVLVATPGRLLDHASQGTVDLSRVQILVLDEADRMLDMGFIRDIRRVLDLLPKQRQNLLFSATFSAEIRKLANNLLHDPASVEVAPPNTTVELIEQKVYPVDRARKRELLSHLIAARRWQQVLVFTRTKHHANRLAAQLAQDGHSAVAIHGNKSQGARTRALADFKAGATRVLVATDIAARGLDIDQLPHVVNYELPHGPEDYLHRIGRTGRAGRAGEAASLVCVDEADLLRDIERLLGMSLMRETVIGFEPDPRVRAEPLQNGGGGRSRRPAGRTHAERSSHHRGARPNGSRRGYRPGAGGRG